MDDNSNLEMASTTQSHHSLSSAVVRQVESLRRQYLQLVDPEQLKMPAMETLRLPEVQAKIFDNFFNDEFRSFPSPKPYTFRVLKRIIGAVELSIVDPEEDVGSPWSSLMAHSHLNSSSFPLVLSELSFNCSTDDSARKSRTI